MGHKLLLLEVNRSGFEVEKMEEKYSSNVLSGGQLGMVEVPSYR